LFQMACQLFIIDRRGLTVRNALILAKSPVCQLFIIDRRGLTPNSPTNIYR